MPMIQTHPHTQSSMYTQYVHMQNAWCVQIDYGTQYDALTCSDMHTHCVTFSVALLVNITDEKGDTTVLKIFNLFLILLVMQEELVNTYSTELAIAPL